MKKIKKIKKEDLYQRMDGRIEWICKHGTGHTIKVPKEYEKINAWWVHACDGCCKKFGTIMEEYIKNAHN